MNSMKHFGMMKLIIQNNPLLFALFVAGVMLTFMPERIKETLRSDFYGLRFVYKIGLLAVVIQALIQMRVQDVHPFIYFEF